VRKIFGLILTSGLLMTNVWADIDCPADSAFHMDMRTMLPDGSPNPTYEQEIATGLCACLGISSNVFVDGNNVIFSIDMVDNEPIRGFELDIHHYPNSGLIYNSVEKREPFTDCGSDATCDENEPGFDASDPEMLDPSGDNYSQNNLSGTEGNNSWDVGELFTDWNGDGIGNRGKIGPGNVFNEAGLPGTMTLLANNIEDHVKVLGYNLSRGFTVGNGESEPLLFITYTIADGASLPEQVTFYLGLANIPGTSMDPNILNVVCGYPDVNNPVVINTSNVATDNGEIFPDAFALNQNYPNPFNPSTQISFDVPADADHVMINIYNILGQNVNTLVNEAMSPGSYTVDWNATDFMGNAVASGIYFYELRSNSFTARKKMLLIR
jgi:hypothetical protein